ncbi:MAG: sulfatase [Chloroflexota bacterium]
MAMETSASLVGAPAGQVPGGATTTSPNLILVISDTLRRDHVGVYQRLNDQRSLAPWPVQTPNIDQFATEAVLYTHAFPESLPTLPVRRALHTGNRTWPFRDWIPQKGDTVRAYGWQRIPEEQVTLAEILSHEGYRCGFFTDAYHQFKPSMNFHRGFGQWGWIRGHERDPYASPSLVREADVLAVQPPLPPGRQGLNAMIRQHLANACERRSEEDFLAPQVFRAGMKWLEENHPGATGQPFFLCLDSFDPHEPWDPPRYYTDLYDPGYSGREVISPRYGPSDYLSMAELRHMRALYAGEVTMVDAWFGRLLQKVRDVGCWDNTAIVFISDHGHQLGEHGLTGKVSSGLYPELIDIPLLIKHPRGEGAGRRVEAFVYNVDTFATALALLGIQPPVEVASHNVWPLVSEVPGSELRVSSAPPPQLGPVDHIVTGFNYDVMLRTERWGYIARGDGSNPRLFDLRADAAWRTDVAADHPTVIKELREVVEHDAGGTLPSYEQVRERIATEWYRLT